MMRIGMIGLGRMGAGITQRLRQRGHEVVGYDRNPDLADVGSLGELIASLDRPRVVWVMVPSGDPTESVIGDLASLLDEGDLVVEGGNSNYRDSIRRAELLGEHGVRFVDAGVSGGIWGLGEGFALMVGGGAGDIAHLQAVFDALTPAGGFVHAGPVGAGHFTKMVHNGIEYGLMHAYGEGYQLLSASELSIDVPSVVKAWGRGSVIRSWLLDLLALALDDDPQLAQLRGYAADSGEGRWTVEEAVRLGVPLTVLSAALFARFSSREVDSPAMRVVAALRHEFGGHAVETA